MDERRVHHDDLRQRTKGTVIERVISCPACSFGSLSRLCKFPQPNSLRRKSSAQVYHLWLYEQGLQIARTIFDRHLVLVVTCLYGLCADLHGCPGDAKLANRVSARTLSLDEETSANIIIVSAAMCKSFKICSSQQSNRMHVSLWRSKFRSSFSFEIRIQLPDDAVIVSSLTLQTCFGWVTQHVNRHLACNSLEDASGVKSGWWKIWENMSRALWSACWKIKGCAVVIMRCCAGLPQLRCAPSLAVHMEIETSRPAVRKEGVDRHWTWPTWPEGMIFWDWPSIQSSSTCTRIRCRHWIHPHFLKGTLRIPLHLDISCCPERSCAHLAGPHQLSAPHGPTLPTENPETATIVRQPLAKTWIAERTHL